MATSSKKDIESSKQRVLARRAYSVPEFCSRYSIGRTKAYAELKAGRLRARKIGRRTIIAEDDAEVWLRQLPSLEDAS